MSTEGSFQIGKSGRAAALPDLFFAGGERRCCGRQNGFCAQNGRRPQCSPIVPGWETAAGHLSALLCLQCNKNVPIRNKCAIQKR